MAKKIQPEEPIGVPPLRRDPEVYPEEIPEAPVLPAEEPDVIPQEDPFETPPYEVPPPGEGP
jgi:hypothetical protein